MKDNLYNVKKKYNIVFYSIILIKMLAFVPLAVFFLLPLSFEFSLPLNCPVLLNAFSQTLGAILNCRSSVWSCQNQPIWNYFSVMKRLNQFNNLPLFLFIFKNHVSHIISFKICYITLK